jgi:hypothetical protein
MAEYADDAYKAFQSFQHGSGAMFGQNAVAALDLAFPTLGYFQREAEAPGPWAQGTGELKNLLLSCVNAGLEGLPCTQVQAALFTQEVHRALSATFGQPSKGVGATETGAMDAEAGVGIASAHAQVQRNQLEKGRAEALMMKCTGDGSDADSLAACQAAASAAQIEELSQTAAMSDQLAEATRLEAVRVAQENAKRKRELEEVQVRQQMVKDAAQHLGDANARIETDGITILGPGNP